MSTPDVRVRLSPEGVSEVIAALRRVQDEARKGNRDAASGLSLVQQAARDLKTLLPTLGLAAAGAALIGLGKQALATADATGKLQQRVGGTVEEVSALTLAFRTNESNQEQLQAALTKTSTLILQVKSGSEATAASLKAIGVNTQEFARSSAPRGLELIAQSLAKIPPGAERAAAAQKIFGRSSADLLVALNAVGEKGIDQFIAKARELGVLVDSDLANAAARARDSLQSIALQAEGLATQFISGFAPEIAAAFEQVGDAISGDGVNGMRTFGEIAGKAIRFVTTLVVLLGKSLGEIFAIVGAVIRGVGDAVSAVADLDFTRAKESIKAIGREIAEIHRATDEDMREVIDRLATPPDPLANQRNQTGTVSIEPSEDAKKIADARLAAQRQALANELALQREFLKTQQQENQIAFSQGLISLREFFNRRRELTARENAAEIAALKAERQAVIEDVSGRSSSTEEERIKAKQRILQLDTQIAQKQVEARRENAAIVAEEKEQAKRLGEEQANLQIRLAELEGKRHEAFSRNLEQEIQQVRELGIRAGQTAEEIEATVNRLREGRQKQFDFEEISRQGAAILDSFQRDADQIRRDMELGLISQAEGTRRLIELEAERLEVLKQIAAATLAAAQATGDEEAIARAQRFSDSVNEISKSYQAATDFATQFKNAGIDAFQQGFADFLANADKIEDIGEAFKSLARTVVQALLRMVAEILAQQAALAIARALLGAASGGAGGATGAGSGLTGAAAGLAQYGGRIRGYEKGGDVWGAKLNIPGPDKIPILAQEGEFMMRKARVDEPGAFDFLKRWNSGQIRLADVLGSVPRYAAGGLVGAGAGGGQGSGSAGGQPPVRIVNLLDPELVTQALSSAAGEKVILNTIERNEERLRRSR